jgi:hypothetical protein
MASKVETIEQIAIETLRQHDDSFSELKERWASLYNRFENKLRAGSITAETEAKVRLGQAYALVENGVSRIMAQSPRFRYLAREKGDTKSADLYNEFSEYQHDQARSQEKYEEAAKWALICGLSGMKMGWKTERIVRKKRAKEAIFGKVITDPTLVSVMDKLNFGKDVKVEEAEDISTWTIDVIRPFDLIWDKEATDPENAMVLGFKARKTMRWLKQNGYDTEAFEGTLKASGDYWKKQVSAYKEGTDTTIIVENIVCEVAELYVSYLNEQGITEYWVVTLAGAADSNIKPVSLKTEENPYDKKFAPIAIFRPMKRPGKFYGFGIIEPVESVIDAEEDTLNMTIEQGWVDLSKPIEFDPNNVLDPDGIRYGARVAIPVREIGKSVGVLQTATPNAGVSSFLMGYLEKTKQNVSAITDYQTGANQYNKGAQTATEINTKTFLSDQRINKILRAFETDMLERTGRMALWLNQQYLQDTAKAIFRILGKKGQMLEKEIKFKNIEAIKDLAVVLGSSAYIMQTEMRNKWSSLLQLMAQEAVLPPGVGVPLMREYAWERLAEEGYGIKDTENLIPSLREREEATVQKKLANLEDAKQENLDPATARVLPDDIHSVHIALHKAALQGQGAPGPDGQTIPYTPEQMVLMTSHLNAHVAAVGGQMSGTNMAMEQAVGQQIQNQVTPQQQPNGPVQ